VIEPINIKHEYEPLMCTKHEFEIKHASKTYFITKTQPKRESNPNKIHTRPTISRFHFNFFKESIQSLARHGN